MTYQSEVLADAPLHYLRLDETSGTTAANLGSSAAAGTISANVTLAQPAARTIDGTSMRFGNAVAASVSTSYSGTMGSTYTIEVWYKSDPAAATTGARCLIRMGTATNYHKLLVYPPDNTVRINDSGSGTSTLATAPEIFDGNWHHIAVTRSGSTATYFVDGVQKATGSFPNTARGLSMAVGSTSTAGEAVNGWIDEPAYYPTVLSDTRIAAHYTAGTAAVSTPVTVQAPAAIVNLSAPAATARIVNNDYRATAPVMTVNVTTSNTVGIKTTKNVTSSVTKMSLTVATVTPTTKFSMSVTSTIANDNNGNNNTTYVDVAPYQTNAGEAFLVFPDFADNLYPSAATLQLSGMDYYSDGIHFTIHRMLSPVPTTQLPMPSGLSHDSTGIAVDLTANGTNRTFSVDITPIAQAWAMGAPNYGVAFIMQPGQDTLFRLHDHRNATVSLRPVLNLTLIEQGAVNVSTVAPAASVNVAMGQARSGTGTRAKVVGAMQLNLSAYSGTTSSVQRNIRATVLNTSFTVQMPGGQSRNPDQYIKAGPMEAWFYSPNATQYISVPSINAAPPMVVNVAGTDNNNISLRTDRRVFVTTAMKMNTTMVGIYSEEGDRYPSYIPLTTDADDQWLKMDELTGTVAADSLLTPSTDGTYVGGPTLGVVGPQLRKAVHFDGIDDYISMPSYPTGAFADMDLTLEFSIKTTQLNGTIVRGGGAAPGGQGGSATIYAGTADSEVRLLNGEIVIYTGSGNNITYRTRKFIADGEWHHVVVSLPSLRGMLVDAYNISASQAFFVTIDGNTEWARYGAPLYGRSFIPTSVMGRLSGGIVSNLIAGDMRDFIVRYNYAVTQNTAQKLYYEWSNALIITPDPMVLTINGIDPHSARGNVKRMIALYGLPYYIRESGFTYPSTRDGYLNYFSVYAGFGIPNNGGGYSNDTGVDVGAGYFSNITPMQYLAVRPFTMEGWLVYPLAIMHQPGSNGGPFSADGMENGEYFDTLAGAYIDDKTGLPRFVDLGLDLNENVTSFDAITAINYPAVQPEDGAGHVSSDPLREFRQHNMGLSDSQWRAARDKMRDSILEAAYDGVSLWVTEPQMAEHLGFIAGWDKHETGAAVEFFGAGNVTPTGYTNKRAEQLNAAHLTLPNGSLPEIAEQGRGQFNYTWQANAKRKIVNLESGLTDVPSWEIKDQIHYYKDNAFDVYSDVVAYDLLDRTNGLLIGDEPQMFMWEQGAYGDGSIPGIDFPYSTGIPRRYIISAKPDGIAGKPISKEMDFYYGPYGAVRQNPWKNNVYTIAAEVGTVVRGRPIAGRAFIEFMSPEQGHWIARDTDKSYWHGEPGKNYSNWDFDSRRDYQYITILQITSFYIQTKSGNRPEGYDASTSFKGKTEDFPVVFTGERSPKEWVRFNSMNVRGLHWLSLTEALPAGEAKAYVPAMTISIAASGVKTTQDRNTTVTVTGAARMDIEQRGAANFRGNDVDEKALPMVLNLSLAGTGKVVKAGIPAEVTITMLDPQVKAGGDLIYVYMDAERNVTLFMKED